MCRAHDHELPEQPPAAGDLSIREARPWWGARAAIGAVRMYQNYISVLTPPVCRFTPTCSQYMVVAIQRHGLVRGLWMGTARLLRCHPFHPGGYDPVP